LRSLLSNADAVAECCIGAPWLLPALVPLLSAASVAFCISARITLAARLPPPSSSPLAGVQWLALRYAFVVALVALTLHSVLQIRRPAQLEVSTRCRWLACKARYSPPQPTQRAFNSLACRQLDWRPQPIAIGLCGVLFAFIAASSIGTLSSC